MKPQLSKLTETGFQITVFTRFNKIGDGQENFYKDFEFIKQKSNRNYRDENKIYDIENLT